MPSPALAADLRLSFQFLTLMGALLQGRFAFLKAVSALKIGNEKTPEELTRTQVEIREVEGWEQELSAERPLISVRWVTPESFEAMRATTLMRGMRNELSEVATALYAILTRGPLENDPVGCRLLSAAFARYAYGNDHLRRRVLQATPKNSPDFALQERSAKGAVADVENANQLLLLFSKEQAQNPDFFPRFRFTVATLPCIFRALRHEISMMLAQFEGGISFTSLEFTPTEAKPWLAVGISPQSAGYWRAYDINPEEAAQWVAAGCEQTVFAVSWKRLGFSASVAAPWLRKRVPPEIAMRWQAKGYTVEFAMPFLEKGEFNPPG